MTTEERAAMHGAAHIVGTLRGVVKRRARAEFRHPYEGELEEEVEAFAKWAVDKYLKEKDHADSTDVEGRP